MRYPVSVPAPWRGRGFALLLFVLTAVLVVTGTAKADDASAVPAAPGGLQIESEPGSLDVLLEWHDVDGASRYWVRWRVAGPGAELNEGVEVTSAATTITVAGHGKWVVRIHACNDAGCGRHLAQRFEVEPVPEPPPTPTPKPPTKPGGLQIESEPGSLDVSLEWYDVERASRYWVRWRVAGWGTKLNEGVEVASAATTITVADYGEWVVRIRACNDAGCSRHLAQRFKVEPAPNRRRHRHQNLQPLPRRNLRRRRDLPRRPCRFPSQPTPPFRGRGKRSSCGWPSPILPRMKPLPTIGKSNWAVSGKLSGGNPPSHF